MTESERLVVPTENGVIEQTSLVALRLINHGLVDILDLRQRVQQYRRRCWGRASGGSHRGRRTRNRMSYWLSKIDH